MVIRVVDFSSVCVWGGGDYKIRKIFA
jgi:hypothetical protein